MLPLLFTLLLSSRQSTAHLSFWHPAQYGFDRDVNFDPYAPGTPFDTWWFHGAINEPPQPGQFYELPAGGKAPAQVACNKEYTTYGGQESPPESACPPDANAMHEDSAQATKGTCIAIAYKSDINDIQPDDFVVISVDYSSAFFRDNEFDIPADLPECPEGGCHCMWGWIHGKENGDDEISFIGMRCKVTGAKPNAPKIAKPSAPVPCKNSPGSCVKGAKTPIYWGVERGNVPAGLVNDGNPPFYNMEMGFQDGAQNDIFEAGGGADGGETAQPSESESSDVAASSGEKPSPAAQSLVASTNSTTSYTDTSTRTTSTRETTSTTTVESTKETTEATTTETPKESKKQTTDSSSSSSSSSTSTTTSPSTLPSVNAAKPEAHQKNVPVVKPQLNNYAAEAEAAEPSPTGRRCKRKVSNTKRSVVHGIFL